MIDQFNTYNIPIVSYFSVKEETVDVFEIINNKLSANIILKGLGLYLQNFTILYQTKLDIPTRIFEQIKSLKINFLNIKYQDFSLKQFLKPLIETMVKLESIEIVHSSPEEWISMCLAVLKITKNNLLQDEDLEERRSEIKDISFALRKNNLLENSDNFYDQIYKYELRDNSISIFDPKSWQSYIIYADLILLEFYYRSM